MNCAISRCLSTTSHPIGGGEEAVILIANISANVHGLVVGIFALNMELESHFGYKRDKKEKSSVRVLKF